MFVQPRNKNFFIGLPTATSNEALAIALELLNDRQLLGGLLDLQHTVEAGIANDGDIIDAYRRQQLATHLVLYEEVGETLQHTTVLPTIPSEEHLTRTEDAADAVNGYTTMAQNMQVVVPELVLDEEGHHRTDGTQETACIGNGVERQVADNISTCIVLAHLIA